MQFAELQLQSGSVSLQHYSAEFLRNFKLKFELNVCASVSRTCHDVFSPKIDSPPRVLLFPSVSARVIVVKRGIVFVHSSAAEPIISCT